MVNYSGARDCAGAKGLVNIKLPELAIVLAVVIALSLATYARNLKWFDPHQMWDDVLEKSESKWRPHYRMGLVLYKSGHYEQALARLFHAYGLKPDARGLLNNIGLAYQRMGRLSEAAGSYTRAIESGDSVSLATLNLGTIYLRRGELEQALTYFLRAIELDPRNAVALVNAGFTYADMGNYEQAIRLHKRAVSVNPYYANAHYGLAIAHEGSGNIQESIMHWQRYLDIGPKTGQWHQRALRNIERLGSLQKSRESLIRR